MTSDFTNFSVEYSPSYFARNDGQIIVTAHNSASYVLATFPVLYADLGQVKYNFDQSGKVHILLGDVFRLAVSNGWTSGGTFTIGLQTDLDSAIVPFTGIKLYNGTMLLRDMSTYVFPPRKLVYWGSQYPLYFALPALSTSYGYIAFQRMTADGWTDVQEVAVSAAYNSISVSPNVAKGVTYRAVRRAESGVTTGDYEFWRGSVDETVKECDPTVYVEWTGDDGLIKSFILRETEVTREVSSTTDLANDRPDNFYSGAFFKTKKDFSLSVTGTVPDLTDDEAVYFDDLVTATNVVVIATDANFAAIISVYLGEKPLARCTAKSITRKIDGKRKDLSFTFDLIKSSAL